MPSVRRSQPVRIHSMRGITQVAVDGVAIEIGGMPIVLRSHDEGFRRMLQDRYSGFLGTSRNPRFEFQITLQAPSSGLDNDDEVRVEVRNGNWCLRRGDFR